MRTHDQNNKVIMPVYKDIDKNIDNLDLLYKDCGDYVSRRFPIGKNKSIYMYIGYIDLMIDRRVIEESILEQLMLQCRIADPNIENIKSSIFDFIRDGALATADIRESDNLDDMALAMNSGDTVLLIDGYSKAIIIATRAWPNRGIQSPDTEVVVRGSKEAFTETMRMNTALIRRRIRDTKLKIKQVQVGKRSRTDIAIVYIDDLIQTEVLKNILDKLNAINTDGILDSGTIEQYIEEDHFSLFPQIQNTERPDKAASSILDGRIVILVDNSPYALILPATINTFFQISEDYYNRFYIASFARIIRYIATFFSVSLPGVYIAITNFHTAMIPTALTLAIAKSRQEMPFPTVVEVILMELAFELLREAGIRLPRPIGSTIGIVGGLIIGQAAVEAKIVSPIIVIIVAVTAISSFTIPDALSASFRLLKYFIILLSALLGIYGFMLANVIILIHLSSLKSFDVPYLSPYVSNDINDFNGYKDSIIRAPIQWMKNRPIFSNIKNRRR